MISSVASCPSHLPVHVSSDTAQTWNLGRSCEIVKSEIDLWRRSGRKRRASGEESRLRRRIAVSLRGQGFLVSSPTPAERSVDREQLRNRVLAFGGIWFLATGLLAAAGFFAPFLASIAILAFGGLVAAALLLFRRFQLGQGVRSAATSLERASKKSEVRIGELELGRHLGRGLRSARSSLEAASKKSEERIEELELGRHVRH